MEIRKSTPADLPRMEEIYADARKFMAEQGNPTQWTKGYPRREILEEDIAKERSFVCLEGDEIVAVFCYFEGVDPTYLKIYDGQWLNSKPYGVVHRIASNKKGAGSFCLDYCYNRCKNLRVDTHSENIPMQKLLNKLGFKYCGVIFLGNGEARIAYQKQ